MSNREYWHRKWDQYLGDDKNVKLLVRFRIYRGKVIRFSIVLRKKFEYGWRNIIRYDNTKKHKGRPHVHKFKLQGSERVEFLGELQGDMGPLMTEIINDLKNNYEKYVENYKHSS